MKLKFWQGEQSGRRGTTALPVKAEEFRSHLLKLGEENAALKQQLGEVEERLRIVLQRTPNIRTANQQSREERERLTALGGVSDTHPLWLAFLSFADEWERLYLDAALDPKLASDEQRQFNAGGADAARSFATWLRNSKVQAGKRLAALTREKA